MKKEEAAQVALATMYGTDLSKDPVDPPKEFIPPEFIPKDYARRTCGTCRGNGVLHIHHPWKLVEEVRQQLEEKYIVTPCGCATKRYITACKKAREEFGK